MLSSRQKKTLIAGILLAAVTLSTVVSGETIGQRIIRLKREQEQGKQSEYTREKFSRETDKETETESAGDTAESQRVERTEGNQTGEIITETSIHESKVTARFVVEKKSSAGGPLDLVPEDAVFCLRINNFGGTLGKMDQYLLGVTPMPISLPTIFNAQLGDLIGNPLLTGVDLGGDVIIFSKMNMKSGKPVITILLPVTDYEEFIKGHPDRSEPDKNGFFVLGRSHVLSAKAGDGKYTYLCRFDNIEMLEEIVSAKKSLAVKISANEAKLGKSAPVWAYGNVEHAVTTFKPMMGMMLQTAPIPGGPEKVIEVLDQIKSLSLTITPTNEKLAIGLSLQAKPGTEIANALVADPSSKRGFELAGYVEDESAVNLAMKFNKPLVKRFVDLIINSMPSEMEQMSGMAEMEGILSKAASNLEEMAYSLTGSDPLNYKQILKVGDTLNAEKLAQLPYAHFSSKNIDAPQIEETTFGRNLIYTMKRPVKGNTPAKAAIPETMHMAVVGEKILNCAGSLDDMKALISKTQTGAGRVSGKMAKAMQLVDNSEDMGFVASINLLKLGKLSSKAASAVPFPQAKMLGGMLSGIEGSAKSCMAAGGKIDKGRVDLKIVLPKDHLKEVVGVIMQKMMQGPQMGPEMRGGPKRSGRPGGSSRPNSSGGLNIDY